MKTPKRFFRLNYVDAAALEAMLKTGTVSCSDPDLAMEMEVGDGIVLARFNESSQSGEVRALGVVTSSPGSRGTQCVDWIRVTETLHPSTQGMRYWRQTKPYFCFDPPVVKRYRLPEMFQRHFGNQTNSVLETPRSVATRSVGRPEVSVVRNEPDLERFGFENDRAGFVYVIRSSYGYKIGKTKRMKQRSQLFSVKLPFEIEVVHYAWFEDYSRAELALHQRFKTKRLNGEWFQLTHGDVEEIKTFRL